ncbi:MAG: hypothetical protein ACREE2_18575 [Stellaceae bacterium]
MRRLIARLDNVAQGMNPFLAVAVIVLLLFNFAYAFSLIDWSRALPPTPTPSAVAAHTVPAVTAAPVPNTRSG